MKKVLGLLFILFFLYQVYHQMYGLNQREDSNVMKQTKTKAVFEKKQLDGLVLEKVQKYSCKKGFCTKNLNELRYLKISYIDFHGEEKIGEMICDEKIADDLLSIFEKLYQAKYQIEKIKLIDEYEGNDEWSMQDNNTSAFNFRYIAGSQRLSNHAKGLAIDINPLYNPQVFENGLTAPKEGFLYKDRSKKLDHMIDEKDLVYQLFKAHGFTWGGDFAKNKDYQHFEKNI